MGKKLTYQEVKNRFNVAGHVLLEKEYVNSKIKMRYRCLCGNIIFASLQSGCRCKICNNKFKEVKNVTKKQMDIFDGLMMSDAFLDKVSGKNRNSRFGLTTSVREFVEKVFDIFFNFPWSKASLKTIDVYNKRTNNHYKSSRLRSLATTFFTNQRKRWYFNGKKIIPRDIEINRNVLLWWYIGDGHLRIQKSRPNYRRVELATDSFSIKELDFVIKKLKLLLGESSIYKERNEIMIGRQALVKFANLMGNIFPVTYYQYKFDFGQYVDSGYLFCLRKPHCLRWG